MHWADPDFRRVIAPDLQHVLAMWLRVLRAQRWTWDAPSAQWLYDRSQIPTEDLVTGLVG